MSIGSCGSRKLLSYNYSVQKKKNPFKNKTRGKVIFLKTLKGLFVWKLDSAVNPVYNGHPWDSKKVAAVQKVAIVQGLVL